MVIDGLELRPAREQRASEHTPFHRWTVPGGEVWTEFYRLDGVYLLRFPGFADFAVKTENFAVACHPVPGASSGTLQHLYLNQVRPLVLSLQGKLVIHASAVEIGGAAVAFVGSTGAGKSTLAASFALAGHPFLTDDGLVVEADGEDFMALPSHPSVRLWADSERALIAPRARRAAPLQYTSKARILADENLVFCAHPSPLRRVYFLGQEAVETIEIRPLKELAAAMEWVKHSFLLDIEERSRLASHFHQVADVAQTPINYRLNFPRRFGDLEGLRSAIVHHLQGSGTA